MRLVIATPLYPPDIGGPATYAKALEEGLPSRGVTVDLVKFGDVRHLPKLFRHIAYYRRVRRAAAHADAVLALDPVSVGLPACLATWRARTPLVVKIVGDYAWEQGKQRFGVTADLDAFVREKRVSLPVRLLRRVQTGVARAAVRIIVPSEYLKGIIEAWGVPSEKIEVIYNAVAREAETDVPASVAALTSPRVVTVGRLVPWKHIDAVIDAVAALDISASLTVVGDGPLRAGLAARAQEKLGARCVFTGSLSHAETLAVMRGADAFVLNSSYEGLSHTLIEAQQLGVPIVATRVGGNPEVVSDQQSGLLVDSGDTEALTRALHTLLTDADTATRVRAGAQKSAERFTTDAMLSATTTFFQNL